MDVDTDVVLRHYALPRDLMYVVATDETKWPRSGSILQSMLKAKRIAHCALRKYQGKEPQHKQCL